MQKLAQIQILASPMTRFQQYIHKSGIYTYQSKPLMGNLSEPRTLNKRAFEDSILSPSSSDNLHCRSPTKELNVQSGEAVRHTNDEYSNNEIPLGGHP